MHMYVCIFVHVNILGVGEELVPKTMRSPGSGFGHYQTVFPCWYVK